MCGCGEARADRIANRNQKHKQQQIQEAKLFLVQSNNQMVS